MALISATTLTLVLRAQILSTLAAGAALIACGTACSDEAATPEPSTPAASSNTWAFPTTTPPPQFLEDCGVVHRYGPNETHAVQGSPNIDCVEARRVGELWYATPGGRSAGYFKTFENWECTAGNANEYLTRCVRTDSSVVYLRAQRS